MSHLSSSCSESASTRGALMVAELGVAVAALVRCKRMTAITWSGDWVFLGAGVVRVTPENERALVTGLVMLVTWVAAVTAVAPLMLLPTMLSVSSAVGGIWVEVGVGVEVGVVVGVERRKEESGDGFTPPAAVPSVTAVAMPDVPAAAADVPAAAADVPAAAADVPAAMPDVPAAAADVPAFGRGRQEDDDGAVTAAAAISTAAAVVSSWVNIVSVLSSLPAAPTTVGVMLTRNNGLSHRFLAFGCS